MPVIILLSPFTIVLFSIFYSAIDLGLFYLNVKYKTKNINLIVSVISCLTF